MLDTIDRIAADYLKPAAIHAAEEGFSAVALGSFGRCWTYNGDVARICRWFSAWVA